MTSTQTIDLVTILTFLLLLGVPILIYLSPWNRRKVAVIRENNKARRDIERERFIGQNHGLICVIQVLLCALSITAHDINVYLGVNYTATFAWFKTINSTLLAVFLWGLIAIPFWGLLLLAKNYSSKYAYLLSLATLATIINIVTLVVSGYDVYIANAYETKYPLLDLASLVLVLYIPKRVLI